MCIVLLINQKSKHKTDSNQLLHFKTTQPHFELTSQESTEVPKRDRRRQRCILLMIGFQFSTIWWRLITVHMEIRVQMPRLHWLIGHCHSQIALLVPSLHCALFLTVLASTISILLYYIPEWIDFVQAHFLHDSCCHCCGVQIFALLLCYLNLYLYHTKLLHHICCPSLILHFLFQISFCQWGQWYSMIMLIDFVLLCMPKSINHYNVWLNVLAPTGV